MPLDHLRGEQAHDAAPRPLGERLWEALIARRVDLAIVAVVTVADQVSKALVRRAIPLHGSVSVIPDVFNLTHVRNTGAAFGFMNAATFPYKTVVITLVAALALVAIAAYSASLPPRERLTRIGLAFVLGGALGNLIDRAVVGYVTDFVDVYWGAYHFWAFNVADSSITVGTSLLILDILGQKTDAPKAP